MIITVWLFIFPFIFKFFFLEYTNSIHSLWALQLLGISLEYDILAHGCLDIEHFTKYTSGRLYLTYWWKFRHINIMRMVLRSILISLHFITVWLHPDVYPFYCIYSGTPCTHCVDIVTLVLHMRNVYIWYTYGTHLSTKRYIVYTTCIHPVSFSRLHIRPLHIYVFSNITFSYCPSRLRMLASG